MDDNIRKKYSEVLVNMAREIRKFDNDISNDIAYDLEYLAEKIENYLVDLENKGGRGNRVIILRNKE